MTKRDEKKTETKRRSTRQQEMTRSERRLMNRSHKKIDAKRRAKQRELEKFKKGKKIKEIPDFEGAKPSIWEKIAEDKVYYQLRQMGDTTRAIDKWQKKRTITSLILALFIGVGGAMFIHPWLMLGGIGLGLFFYKSKAKNVDRFFKGWKFERQLNFSKFCRLVIPYLKAADGQVALYTILNKIALRTENEADKKNLYQLMSEMTNRPGELQPFLDFAERSSGTDMSYLFMSTLYDFQQSTFDTQVIDELGRIASEDMMKSIDEIIDYKLRRFIMFPTKIVMSSFILVIGLGLALLMYNIKGLDLSGVGNIEGVTSEDQPTLNETVDSLSNDESILNNDNKQPSDINSEGSQKTGGEGSGALNTPSIENNVLERVEGKVSSIDSACFNAQVEKAKQATCVQQIKSYARQQGVKAGNGSKYVTLDEAKSAGFKGPFRKGQDWLYGYMIDTNEDGVIGE